MSTTAPAPAPAPAPIRPKACAKTPKRYDRPPLKYLLNPCDIDRAKVLAPIGDAFAAIYRRFTAGTECECCLGARVAGLTLAATGLGLALAHTPFADIATTVSEWGRSLLQLL